MKKVIPFSKTIHFKTMIQEITDIEVKHTLKVTEDETIEGDILVEGSYKMTEASQLEETFQYTLPFTIEVDDKYDITNADINIHDFYFEIINEEDLKINVELEISKVEEKVIDAEIEPLDSIVLNEVEKKVEEIQELEEENDREEEEVVADFMESNEEHEESKVEKIVESTKEVMKEEKETPTVAVFKEEPVEEVKKVEEVASVNEAVPSIFSSINQEETFVTYYVYIVREGDTVDSILDKYKTNRELVSLYNDLSDVKVGSKIIIPCSNE